MKVKVLDNCISCGMCANIAPDVFHWEDEKKSIPICEVTDFNKDRVEQALDSCPVAAIIWDK